MAKKETISHYIVTVDKNPEFCGKGAGGIQFANGEAKVTSERMARWFEEHDGYTVKAIPADPADEDKK